MQALKDDAEICKNISTAKKWCITALHKFIFEEDGDRKNRCRIRDFTGFTFDAQDDLWQQKSEYIDANLSETDLAVICSILGLEYTVDDAKMHIFEFLRTFEKPNDDDEEDDDNESDGKDNDDNDGGSEVGDQDDDDQGSNSVKKERNNGGAYQPRFVMNFRDIEDSIRTYDGSDNVCVRVWVREFEETAALMNWDELQKFVFAKKSIKGLAKTFISSERNISSWSKLKAALIDEFGKAVNSALLHKKLVERKMKKDEGVREYFFHMKDLASRGSIEDGALIQYVIDGISDMNINKAILYGAKNLSEFKDKLKYYDILREKNKATNVKNETKFDSKQNVNKQSNESKNSNESSKKTFNSKCYNCGEENHKSSECKNKEKGTKCFSCNLFGHISKNCPSKKSNVVNVNVVNKYKNNAMIKEIKFGDFKTSALFDTGSKFNIMTENVYKSLKNSKMTTSNVYLIGFGNKDENKIKSIGRVNCAFEIDNENFELQFEVVPNICLDVPVVLGTEICSQAEIKINPSGLIIKKLKQNDESDEHFLQNILKIDAKDFENTFDFDVSVDEAAKQKVIEMVTKYKPNKIKTTNVQMKIILKDDNPISSGPRRLPIAERGIVEQQVDEWLKNGIIEESESEYSSPVVLVRKRDGTPRLCVDYRRVNKVIVKDRFPLPLIEDQLDRLQNAKVFSTIDLKNGFFHVDVDETSRKYTSFVTHNGQYQFKKVPFGLSNSPGVFQRYVNAIFRDLARRGIALPYIDDVIIPADDEEQAIQRLEEVLNLCRDYGLEINFKKCQFLKRRVEFLGHVIENHEVSPSPAKVEALKKFKLPANLKELESFIGLANYFRKFVPNFSIIAKPLTDLRKKGQKFEIKDEQIASFDAIKDALCKKPTLRIFNQRLETEVHTDASMHGYGAVLLQRAPDDGCLHPIYFMSKKTTDAEKKYSSYELEVLAIIEALKKFRVYLLGLHFKLVTDCNAFTKTLEKKDLSTRVARWVLLLEEYDYEVEHRSGSQMRHVDALSRYPVMIIDEDTVIAQIRNAQSKDDELAAIIEIVRNDAEFNNYFLKADVLFKLKDDRELIVIPESMQTNIIRQAHEKGHFAVKKTMEIIRQEYFIPNLEAKVQKIIGCCVHCILINRKRGKMEGELHPINKGDIPLNTYHVDFLGPLATTNKCYNHILAVIDAFTKFCWLYPTKTTSAKDLIAKLQQQSRIFGNPMNIISDRGSAFTSEDFKQYCSDENINHFLITTGLPRANGQVERLNAVIASVLAKLSFDDPTKWYKYVDIVQQIINSTYSRSTQMTPFELMVGVKMRTKEDLHLKELIEGEIVKQFNDDRDNMRQRAKESILRIQSENKRSYDKKRKPARRYNIGDLVAIKRTQFGGGLKLRPKYFGPYEVTRVKQNNSYDVIKVGTCEGPNRTTSCAEFMKPWLFHDGDDAFEANVMQDGRVVGSIAP